MEQRISLVTLAVADVGRSREFYCDGLGWEPLTYVDGEVLMIRTGAHLLLSLWDRAHFTAEVGEPLSGPGIAPVTLAHNLASRAEVDEVVASMQAAGGLVVAAPEPREWGGYSGYVADPDGYRWEIAHAPGEVGEMVVP
ncbi:VOC family protein [Nocardioides insulae]|uniref:VOC family protein n=1 Tax=Nocardioides insulae TaxID=394734 RepID=UPI0003F6DA2A|nr:VOC family protein [Nocardioides insulae]